MEVAKESMELFGRDGVEALIPLIHPEFETTIPPGFSTEPDTYRGHEGLRRYFDTFYEAMDKIWLEAEDFREVGGKVLVHGKLWTRGRSTGLETNIEAVFVWTIKDEKVFRAEIFATDEEALAAIDGAQSSAD